MPGTEGLGAVWTWMIWGGTLPHILDSITKCLRVKNFYFVLSDYLLIRKYLIIYKQQFILPYICWPLKLDKISLSFTRVEGLGIMWAQQSSDATWTPSLASWFLSKGPPRESPSEAAAGSGAGARPCGAVRGRRQGWVVPGLRLPLFQVLPLPARSGIAPKASSWWHILLWPSRAEVGQGRGRKIKPQRLTTWLSVLPKRWHLFLCQAFRLTSSRGLRGLTGLGTPQVGGSRPFPAFLPPWAPAGQAVSTPPRLPRPGTELDVQKRPHCLEPRLPQFCQPGQRNATAATPPARPVPAPRLRPRPPGPPCTAPRPHHSPRARPGELGLQAEPRTCLLLP